MLFGTPTQASLKIQGQFTGTSLASQWLGLCTLTAKGPGLTLIRELRPSTLFQVGPSMCSHRGKNGNLLILGSPREDFAQGQTRIESQTIVSACTPFSAHHPCQAFLPLPPPSGSLFPSVYCPHSPSAVENLPLLTVGILLRCSIFCSWCGNPRAVVVPQCHASSQRKLRLFLLGVCLLLGTQPLIRVGLQPG